MSALLLPGQVAVRKYLKSSEKQKKKPKPQNKNKSHKENPQQLGSFAFTKKDVFALNYTKIESADSGKNILPMALSVSSESSASD